MLQARHPYLYIVHPDLSVVPLSLQFQFNIQHCNLGVVIVLGLHLKAGV